MKHLVLSAFLLAATSIVQAQSAPAPAATTAPVTADGAWIRASVRGQVSTGGFLRLTAREPVSLVGISTPVAGVAEVHDMKMEGDVMRMRAVPALELPAGRSVELKPGGQHLMLMDLKTQLQPSTSVPVTLTFRHAGGRTSKLELTVPVLARAPDGAPAHKH